MITPKDIENPKRKSGYDHVAVDNGGGFRPKPYRALDRAGGNHGKGAPPDAWRGPRRKTALEAAQDYCTYINGAKTITPKDIENPKRKSGYDHVQPANAHGGPRAIVGTRAHHKGEQTNYKALPRRRPGEEALCAQDYCDYVNGLLPQVHTKTSSGRPDYYKDSTGRLHVDLPPAATTTKATKARTAKSSERDLMLRMQSKVNALLGPNDFAEAKAGVGRQQIATAVGQLLFKHCEEGKGRMFIVLPSTPDKAAMTFLRRHNITLIVENA